MIPFTAWESSLKKNLEAAGKADRKKWLGGFLSCFILSATAFLHPLVPVFPAESCI